MAEGFKEMLLSITSPEGCGWRQWPWNVLEGTHTLLNGKYDINMPQNMKKPTTTSKSQKRW